MPSNLITVTQGTWLPEEVKVSMLPDLPKLTTSMDPSEWCRIVRKALRLDLLHFLVEISVIHPKPSDKDYENWLSWSAAVYLWLYTNMEENVRNMIHNMSDRPEDLLADWL
ncbi:hypothetical protein N7517_000981 [Penicillium concentricum]|uniref:Uncharacterized protein n=1 Tax=Penicillium concentricum TaxID=293559 RepID=A0A9W9SS15_9EURO|nr:uncharacterized protein N7517_000981 [Penicillium concentricum]KAJ5383070.1 hypothetical protein N7517_000981 [Penicillium concentricum]